MGCGSPRPPLCNAEKPDEIIVRPETCGHDSDGIRGQCRNARIEFLTRLLRCLATLPTLSAPPAMLGVIGGPKEVARVRSTNLFAIPRDAVT